MAGPRESCAGFAPCQPWEKCPPPSMNLRQHRDKFFPDHFGNTYPSISAERNSEILSLEPVNSPCLEPRGSGTGKRFTT